MFKDVHSNTYNPIKQASVEKIIPVAKPSTQKIIPERRPKKSFLGKKPSIEKATPDRRSKYTIPASVEIYHPDRRSKKVFPFVRYMHTLLCGSPYHSGT